jgi:hypothetical protein
LKKLVLIVVAAAIGWSAYEHACHAKLSGVYISAEARGAK